MTALTASRFEMGRVISRTFGVIGSNIASFTLLSLLLCAVPNLAFQVLMAGAKSAGPGGAGLVGLLGGLVSMIFAFVLQACLVQGTVAYLQGKPASLGAGLSRGFGAIAPLLGLSILMGLLEGLAFIAFVVPGLILMTRWLVAVPVLIVERNRGVNGSMARSADLTRGHRWSVFSLLLIFMILAWIVQMLTFSLSGGFGAMASALRTPASAGAFSMTHAPVTLVVQSVVAALISMVGAVGAASLYFELRSLREGVGIAELASVFD